MAGAGVRYYAGGAYRIEVPTAWNGALVLFAHGYRGEGPDITVSDSPIREHLIQNGYAWAASSYRGNGYRPDWGVDDTLALRDMFIERHGTPRWTILHGQSMGGHILVASLEQHPDVYQAALSECGSNHRGLAIAGLVLNLIFVILTAANSAIGAYMGFTGAS